jgi:hypothetical protein
MRAPSRRNPGHSRAGYNPGLLSTLADYSSSRKPDSDSPSDMAGPNSDAPAVLPQCCDPAIAD